MRHTASVLLLFVLSATAQDFLDPLIITATRDDVPMKTVPYSSELFSSSDFRENTVRTIPDALRYTPGVLVQKTAYGHGSPYIRGFTGRQNLFLIDGVRFNNSTFRGGPIQSLNTIDSFSLDRFELIRSQGSVLYGSDAAGGTLNAITKSSGFEDEADGEVFSHGSAYYEYRTNGRGSHIGRVETRTGVGGKFGLHLGISAKEFGDIEDSAVGLMRGTGYPEEAIDARIDFAVSTQTKLTAVYQYFNQDNVSRWHSTRNNPGWIHGSHVVAPGTFIARDYDQERSLGYIRLSHQNDQADAFVKSITTTLSYQSSSEDEFQVRTPTDWRFQTYDTDTTGLDIELTSDIAGGSLVYGVDYYHDSVDSFASRDRGTGFVFDRATRPVGDDSSYDLLGAYSQYVRPIGERFELTGGIRYTYARAEVGKSFNSTPGVMMDQSAEESWDDLSASLRGTYGFTPEWIMFGGISQAFRSPNLNDLSGNLLARSDDQTRGSLDVDPEEFTTFELGVRNDTKDFGFSAAVFYTDISDQITSVPVTPAAGAPSVTTNGTDGYVYGIELEGYYNLNSQWTLSGFAAWQDGRTQTPAFVGGPENDEYLSRILPLSGSVALRWQDATRPLWIEGRVLASAEADRLSSGDRRDTQRIPTGGTPSYAAVSLRAGYQPSEHLQLTAALENLLDDDYRLHGSGQNEPGFNAILGVKVLW